MFIIEIKHPRWRFWLCSIWGGFTAMGGRVDPHRASFPQEIWDFSSLQPLPLLQVDGKSHSTRTDPTNLEYFIVQTVHGNQEHQNGQNFSAHGNSPSSSSLPWVLSSSLPPHFPSVICGLMLNLQQRREPKAKIPAGAAGPLQTWAENSIGKITGLEQRILKAQISGLIPFVAAKAEITSLLKLFSLYCVNITPSRTELSGVCVRKKKKIKTFPGVPLDFFFFWCRWSSFMSC